MAKRRSGQPGPFVSRLWLDRERIPSFEKYPFKIPTIRNLDVVDLHPKVTYLVGENGSGKSTILEAIAIGCNLNPEGGSRNFNFETRSSHSDLHQWLRVAKTGALPRDSFFLRAESLFNVATEIERIDRDGGPPIIEDYGGVSLHEQSHGESFFAIFKHRFFGPGLYLLDEPEAALSPKRQLSFLSVLHRLCLGGSQFVICTHSPIVMAYPDSWIYVLTETGPIRTPYEETEHFQTTSSFLQNRELLVASIMNHTQKFAQSDSTEP